MQMHLSMVPTGPPQHGNRGFMVAGAFAANSSSIFCLAASFIESPMPLSIDAMSNEASEKSLLRVLRLQNNCGNRLCSLFKRSFSSLQQHESKLNGSKNNISRKLLQGQLGPEGPAKPGTERRTPGLQAAEWLFHSGAPHDICSLNLNHEAKKEALRVGLRGQKAACLLELSLPAVRRWPLAASTEARASLHGQFKPENEAHTASSSSLHAQLGGNQLEIA